MSTPIPRPFDALVIARLGANKGRVSASQITTKAAT